MPANHEVHAQELSLFFCRAGHLRRMSQLFAMRIFAASGKSERRYPGRHRVEFPAVSPGFRVADQAGPMCGAVMSRWSGGVPAVTKRVPDFKSAAANPVLQPAGLGLRSVCRLWRKTSLKNKTA